MSVMQKTGWTRLAMTLLAVCFIGQGSSEPAEKKPEKTVAGVIESYIQASGGSALAEIKTETRKGTLLRGTTGKVPFVTSARAPGEWRYTQTFAWGDQVCSGCDGRTAWVQDTRSVTGMSARNRLDLELLLDFQAPLRIRSLFPEMAIKGPDSIGDRKVTAVSATSKEGFETELAFDDETGLLVRAGEMVFEDYRDVGPVKRPFRILLGKDEGEEHLRMKMEFSETRHGLEAENALFRRPACVLPLGDAPLFKRRNRVKVEPAALEALVGKYRHPERPGIVYEITRQKNHLLVGRTDWLGQRIEIIPESDDDFFVEFLNQEYHFIKDAAGKATHLEIRADRTLKAERIE